MCWAHAVGIVMAVFAVLYLVLTQGGRIGAGGNEAVFAFAGKAVSAISAVIPILKHHAILNGPTGLYWAS